MTIITEIQSGKYDAELAEMEKAVSERLVAVRKSRSTSDYGIGARVKFNTFCGTKYLQGHTGSVVGLRGKKLLVTLDTPVGRFGRYEDGKLVSAQISVPPSIVDLVTID
jgi:ribosomal protein L21E